MSNGLPPTDPESDSLDDIDPLRPWGLILPAIEQLEGSPEEVAEVLKDNFTSDDLRNMLVYHGRVRYTTKDERAKAVVRQAARTSDDFDPFDDGGHDE